MQGIGDDLGIEAQCYSLSRCKVCHIPDKYRRPPYSPPQVISYVYKFWRFPDATRSAERWELVRHVPKPLASLRCFDSVCMSVLPNISHKLICIESAQVRTLTVVSLLCGAMQSIIYTR